ncbi:cell wall hydrolase [Salinibacter phage M31CR41-2]|uniref:Cell wall hydrolase n=1 Tax=Salinibacter phage M31CR41-2 TaxID=2681614 RepID=A0A2I6UH34_9CAUD|nr:cell wall hydrolase [Salinibacter phage M31CR41-2]AUO79282.1 cell wall hydrolase [Salinibacter phage M31CR41-2]AUO79352.1 cell wall hydrolase [Salinibacter virus M31CR41-3]
MNFSQGYSIFASLALFIGMIIVLNLDHAHRKDHNRVDSLRSVVEQQKQEIREQHRTIQRLHSRLELLSADMASVITAETKRPEEMEPIAWAMRNRVESDRHPDGLRAVLTDHAAFTPVMKGDLPAPLPEARRAAMSVLLAPATDDLTDGATHYYSPRSMRPAYSRPAWASRLDRVHVRAIPDHRFRFYRD